MQIRWMVEEVAMLAPQAGIDIYAAPPGQKVRIGRRYAREGEMEDFLLQCCAHAARDWRGGARAATAPARRRCRRIWANGARSVEFVLGPFGCAKDLADVSALDFARSAERDVDAFCRAGYGTLLAKLGEGLPVAARQRR